MAPRSGRLVKALAVAVLAAAAATTAAPVGAQEADPLADLFPTASALRARFPDSAFAINASSLPALKTDGGAIIPVLCANNPVLGLLDIHMEYLSCTLIPGGHNLPHIHPRGTKAILVTVGTLTVYIVDEFGPVPRTIVSTVGAGGIAFFPRGLVHGQYCATGGGHCKFSALTNSADAGFIAVAGSLCGAPIKAVAASVGGSTEATAAAVCARVSANPAPPFAGGLMCLTGEWSAEIE